MKYTAVDELTHFQFHDAHISNISFVNRDMVWEVSAVNATTSNTQNNFDEDMCVKNALITFENVNIENIVFGAYKTFDSNNNLIKSQEATAAEPAQYFDILKDTLQGYCYIYGMEDLPATEKVRYRACFDIDGGVGSFYLTINFTKSVVKWEEFSGKAWYEDEKWKKQGPVG